MGHNLGSYIQGNVSQLKGKYFVKLTCFHHLIALNANLILSGHFTLACLGEQEMTISRLLISCQHGRNICINLYPSLGCTLSFAVLLLGRVEVYCSV